MSAPSELYELLAGDASLDAAVDGRVYAGWLPESDANSVGAEFPCVVFRQVSLAPDEQTHDGIAYERPRFALDCWALPDESSSAYAKAHAIADIVKSLVRAGTYRVEGETDLPETDTTLHRVVIDAVLWTDAN